MTLWTTIRDRITPTRVARGGLLSTTIETAQKSGFFTWFAFVRTTDHAASGLGGTITFRPSGPKFHDLVEMQWTLDPALRISAMELVLSRAFIDDAREGIYARDISKSFLRAATPDADRTALGELANEFEFSHSFPVVVAASEERPQLPAQPSPGFEVFLGLRERVEQSLSTCTLMLEQTGEGADRWLRISVAAH